METQAPKYTNFTQLGARNLTTYMASASSNATSATLSCGSKNMRRFGLRSLIETLKLQLPEEEIQGVYNPGDEYDFYRDLSSLVEAATNEILIVDAYLDEEVFNLYVSKVSDSATVRILSDKIGPNVEVVAGKYEKSQQLKLRSSRNIHDRMVFLDQRGWVIGQSIKDAAKKKPTCLVELTEPLLALARDAYEKIWKDAKSII